MAGPGKRCPMRSGVNGYRCQGYLVLVENMERRDSANEVDRLNHTEFYRCTGCESIIEREYRWKLVKEGK